MADKGIWQGYPLDVGGNIIPGAEITIRDLSDTIVTLWEDEDGNVTKSNPFQADANGYASAYANTGYYNIEAEAGTSTTTLNNVYIQARDDDAIRIANGTSSHKVVYAGMSLNNDISQGDIGPGAVGMSELKNGSVGRSQIKTTTGITSRSADNGTQSSGFNLVPGGSWSFNIGARYISAQSPSNTGAYDLGRSYNGDTDIPLRYEVFVSASSGSDAVSVEVRSRYIQSSPPYDHGDGEVFGYVYGRLNANGSVGALYVSEDPPWYGNTRHEPWDQFVGEDGKEYGRFVYPCCTLQDLKEGKISKDYFMDHCGDLEGCVEEITTETKLRGMEDFPQPFLEEQGPVVLIDPMDLITGKLINMMKAGETVHSLFDADYLRVDNEPCNRCGPPGVAIHQVKWKNT